MPADGVRHVSQYLQLKGSRGGDKIQWEFKLLTAVAVDTLFVKCSFRGTPPQASVRQGPAYVRADTLTAFALVPPITF
eukprot:6180103-Pleurochrysis_carterae.AAC.1